MIELRPHQRKAVDQLHNGSILWGGMGSGKTITSLVYYWERVCQGVVGDISSLRNPVDLYVITTAKKRDSYDWETDAVKLGVPRDASASPHGISITVDSWNNIHKYKGVENAFFIFDEQRLVGSGTWTKTFVKIAKSNQWILLSATPGDTWLDYIPVFLANGFYKNRTEFKREHVVYNTYSKFPKVDHYVGVGRLVRLRNQILVHMPYDSHTVWNCKDVEVSYDKELFDKAAIARWHVFEERPLRDVAELFLVMRKIVNSDPSRLDALRRLMDRHPKLVVFYNFDYELEILRCLKDTNHSSESSSNLGKSGIWNTSTVVENSNTLLEEKDHTSFALAEWNGHKHEPIPKSDRWVYLVQYTAGSEGWNCVETDAMVFYSLTYSYKAFHQAHGRIDRLNTPFKDLFYYYFISGSVIDRAVQKALKAKKSFNEADYGRNL